MTRCVIGVDFDNTIVSYDDAHLRAAVDRGLIDAGTDARASGRCAIASASCRTAKIEWQKLQALVYGPLMPQAALIDGVGDVRARVPTAAA